MQISPNDTAMDRPFPLLRIFRTRIVPAMLLILALMAGLGGFAELRIAREIYLNIARSRAEVIAGAVAAEAPAAWQTLQDAPLLVLKDPSAAQALQAAFAGVLDDARIAKIKIYEPGGRLILGGLESKIGMVETAPQLRESLITGEPVAVRTEDAGLPVYEFYIPVRDHAGAIRLAFEIYEPAGFLDRILWLNTLPAIALPAILMTALLVWLARIVGRAQSEIDQRATAVLGLRQRLERLVSSSAKGAMRRASDDGAIVSRLVDMTLFHSDVVDFTGFSESNPPQRVVDFLNRLMTIQVEELHRFGGDVDKMIGDAVLACFEGPDRAERAVAAAKAIQTRLAVEPGLPRTIRIGLHDGYVISGAIGPSERQDFTVIGDSVNVAARLCAHAAPGELVADNRTLARAGHPENFSEGEDIALKGRQEHVTIRRWSPTCVPAPSEPA